MLYYLRAYPTFDVLAATFGLPRSKACEHAHRLAKALERTLRTLGILPARTIDSLAQMQAVFANVPVLWLDATARRHCSTPPNAPTSGRRRRWTARPTTPVKKTDP